MGKVIWRKNEKGKLEKILSDYDRGYLDAIYMGRSTKGPYEDKPLFVQLVNDALVACGAGMYDRFEKEPMLYEKDGLNEYVTWRDKKVLVTGYSLVEIMRRILEGGLL